MPTSVRVIRVIDNEYTVEVETEVEDIKELFSELTKTKWGRKVAYLLDKMLPNVPEYQPPSMKEEAEAEQKRIKEYEEKLRKEGASKKVKELIEKYGDFEKIKENTEKAMRDKYLKYIRKKQGRNHQSSNRPKCFGKYWDRISETRNMRGIAGIRKLQETVYECNKCKYKPECMKLGKKKD